jgi:transcriptional regulator with XRE-family HTH domain
MLFNERLKKLRKEKKITQKTLANAINVAERYIQALEYGKTKPGFDILLALADYFKVSLDYLTGRSDETKEESKQNTEAKTKHVTPNPRLLALLKLWEEAPPEEKDEIFRALSEEER